MNFLRTVENFKREAKIMETLRLTVRDAIQQYVETHLKDCDDPVDTACDIADVVFESLGISEKEQDIEGAKVKIVRNKRRIKICEKLINTK
jgi:hypothetical protein